MALAWIAGFFDGEGSIGIYKRSGNGPQSYRLTARASQKNPDVLYALQEAFGGYVRNSPGATPEWQVANRKAGIFLEAVRPYLRVKHAEADVALEFQKRQVLGRSLVDGAEYAARLKELKRG